MPNDSDRRFMEPCIQSDNLPAAKNASSQERTAAEQIGREKPAVRIDAAETNDLASPDFLVLVRKILPQCGFFAFGDFAAVEGAGEPDLEALLYASSL